jgi:hypothetical protein
MDHRDPAALGGRHQRPAAGLFAQPRRDQQSIHRQAGRQQRLDGAHTFGDESMLSLTRFPALQITSQSQ